MSNCKILKALHCNYRFTFRNNFLAMTSKARATDENCMFDFIKMF